MAKKADIDRRLSYQLGHLHACLSNLREIEHDLIEMVRKQQTEGALRLRTGRKAQEVPDPDPGNGDGFDRDF